MSSKKLYKYTVLSIKVNPQTLSYVPQNEFACFVVHTLAFIV